MSKSDRFSKTVLVAKECLRKADSVLGELLLSVELASIASSYPRDDSRAAAAIRSRKQMLVEMCNRFIAVYDPDLRNAYIAASATLGRTYVVRCSTCPLLGGDVALESAHEATMRVLGFSLDLLNLASSPKERERDDVLKACKRLLDGDPWPWDRESLPAMLEQEAAIARHQMAAKSKGVPYPEHAMPDRSQDPADYLRYWWRGRSANEVARMVRETRTLHALATWASYAAQAGGLVLDNVLAEVPAMANLDLIDGKAGLIWAYVAKRIEEGSGGVVTPARLRNHIDELPEGTGLPDLPTPTKPKRDVGEVLPELERAGAFDLILGEIRERWPIQTAALDDVAGEEESVDGEFQPAAWFTLNTTKVTPARLRKAAQPNRKTKRVRSKTIDGVKCYSVADARRWWPSDMAKP